MSEINLLPENLRKKERDSKRSGGYGEEISFHIPEESTKKGFWKKIGEFFMGTDEERKIRGVLKIKRKVEKRRLKEARRYEKLNTKQRNPQKAEASKNIEPKAVEQKVNIITPHKIGKIPASLYQKEEMSRMDEKEENENRPVEIKKPAEQPKYPSPYTVDLENKIVGSPIPVIPKATTAAKGGGVRLFAQPIVQEGSKRPIPIKTPEGRAKKIGIFKKFFSIFSGKKNKPAAEQAVSNNIRNEVVSEQKWGVEKRQPESINQQAGEIRIKGITPPKNSPNRSGQPVNLPSKGRESWWKKIMNALLGTPEERVAKKNVKRELKQKESLLRQASNERKIEKMKAAEVRISTPPQMKESQTPTAAPQGSNALSLNVKKITDTAGTSQGSPNKQVNQHPLQNIKNKNKKEKIKVISGSEVEKVVKPPIDINLIPEEFVEVPRKQVRARFIILALSVVICALFMGIAYLWGVILEKRIDKEITDLNLKITDLDKEIDTNKTYQKKFESNFNKVKLVYDLLNRHVYKSKQFEYLEKYTHEKVYIRNVSFSEVQKAAPAGGEKQSAGVVNNMKISLNLTAVDLESAIQQYLVYKEKADSVRSVKFGAISFSLDKSGQSTVDFNLEVEVDPNIIYEPF